MSETPELTLRDVLQQIDRRLSLIEEDLRQVDGKVDAQGGNLRAEITSARQEAKNDSASLRLEMKNDLGALHRDLDTRFRWLTGIVLLSWLSLMSTMLLK